MEEALPSRLPRKQRRAHLLDVAAQLIIDQGIDAVTMERVASVAGVSKGLGYAYFTNRGDLLRALLERELGTHEKRAAKAMAEASDFESRIRAAVHTWFDTVAERGALLGALLQANRKSRTMDERRNRYYRNLEKYYGDMAVEELGVPPEKAVAAAAILIAGLSGVLERWLEAGDSRETLEDTYVDLAMGGLRGLARPSGDDGEGERA